MNHKLVFLAVLLGLVSLSYSVAGTTQATGCSILGYTGNTAVCNFTSSGTFNLSLVNSNINAYVLVVGGGGGGGGVSAVAQYAGGGGGGGSIVYNTSYILTAGSSYTATVGAAGAAGGNTGTKGGNGTNSTFGVLTAGGGRSGGGSLAADAPGTNGTNFTGGAGGGAGSRATTEQGGTSGFEGYGGNSTSGGGGGGGAGGNSTTMGGGNAIASATAPVAGLGGNGSSYTISGASVAYGGGGGGGTNATGTVGAGGTGGGGSGGKNAVGVAGTANRGGGGGGAGGSSARVGGAGGTGVIILNYTAYEINVSFAANSPASAVISKNYIEVNVTSTIAYASVLDHINITIYNAAGGIVASSESNTTPFFYNITGLADGNYSLNATAQDTQGFVDKTETRWFGVDTTNPAINIYVPTTNTTVSTTNNWIDFNVTTTDLNLKNLTMKLFNSTGGTLNTTTTSQTWWNTTWRYKMQINITGGTCTAAYCQFSIPIILNSTLTNGSDIRILDSTETTSFNFWREESTWTAGNASGNIWVNVTNQTSMIYIYYNASGVPDISSMDSVFIFGDDFDTTLNTSKWNWTNNAPTTTSGYVQLDVSNAAITSISVNGANNAQYEMHGRIFMSTYYGYFCLGSSSGALTACDGAAGKNDTVIWNLGFASSTELYINVGTTQLKGVPHGDTSVLNNQWQQTVIQQNRNISVIGLSYNSTTYALNASNNSATLPTAGFNYIFLRRSGAGQMHVDWIFIRPFELSTASFVTGTETPIQTSYNIFNNYTNLSTGLYYFNATCYDFMGYSNATETRNVTIVSAVASFFSMVGGAINWTWQTVDAGEIIMSGSPINWTWQVFAAGSGRQIPNGTATNWTWVNE